MKTRPQSKHVQGSVLVIALAVVCLLGLGLASHLLLMRWQHVSVVRSQAWNSALAMAEAGVEEALAQLNPSALIFSTNINRAANGWSLQADGMYHAPRRTLQGASYDVAISADTLPTIYATGYVTIPSLSATVSRSVRVGTGIGALFRGSLAARVSIDLKGNKITTDSFDSLDPAHSTGGLYDPAKRKAGGDIASTDGMVNIQNANIMGTVFTGPEGGYTIRAQGTVGDLGWVLGGSLGVQDGHYKNDFNMDFPVVLPPYDSAVPPAGETVNGTNYTWVLRDGNYMHTGANGVDLKTGETILVAGQARIYVTGDFIMRSGSRIIITPGSRLELYVAGANTSISTVNNQGNCAAFSYFGLPSNRSITLAGNDVFLGTIYAPTADLTLSGGGSNTLDYQGAIAINTIHMNGHFNFHFDENLRRNGPVRGYQITSWAEL